MDSNQNNYPSETVSETEGNIRDIFDKYITRWKWFVLGLSLSFAIAFLYLRYSTPLYEVAASILIKDDKKGWTMNEESAFDDLGLFKNNNNVDNEIEILKSRTLMTRVAQELDLNIQIFENNGPVPVEKYANKPLHIIFLGGDSLVNDLNKTLIVSIGMDNKFILKDEENLTEVEKSFGELIETDFGKIIITYGDVKPNSLIGKEIVIKISPLKGIVDRYRKSIQIKPASKMSNVIDITLRDPVPEKAVAIVDNLIKQHNADAISDKNQVSQNTAAFINERMALLVSELSDVESRTEIFKTQHKLVDAVSEAGLFYNSGSENEKKLIEVRTQMLIVDYMYDYLNQHSSFTDLIPSNLGFTDQTITKITESYNTLILERNKILKNSSEKNPIITNLDGQIEGLIKNLKESLANLKASLEIKSSELSKQDDIISSKIASVPKYEREYRDIQRQQQIKESLYLYLLQKREETAIALAVTVANAKIIDKAFSNEIVVFPDKKMIYIIAFILGLAFPVIIIYIFELLDTKVNSIADIEKIKAPFIGHIPFSDSKERLVVKKDDRSAITESFRMLRANIDFMINGKQGAKTIFVTSTVGKEGKTFVAINLACSIATSGKKVLLIEMDLRVPKILKYLHLQKKIGIVDYIIENTLTFENIITNFSEPDNCDLIFSGTAPPNPTELLMNDRVKELFEKAKEQYDYIIVDTAPVGLVADTLLLNRYSDLFIFVSRVGYSDKRLINIPETFNKEKRLTKMAVLLNCSEHKKYYGYGYGYGYLKPKPWWKRI